jgi:hypothetical protein
MDAIKVVNTGFTTDKIPDLTGKVLEALPF